MVWQLSPRGPFVMLDVPKTEDKTGQAVPQTRVLAATKLLDQIIRLINNELKQFEQQLIRDLTDAVTTRRGRLGRIGQ